MLPKFVGDGLARALVIALLEEMGLLANSSVITFKKVKHLLGF